MAPFEAYATSDEYYCYALSSATARDKHDITAFRPVDEGGAGLTLYLQKYSCADEVAGTMRTYLVRDKVTNELAGYFSLKAGLVSINEAHEDGTTSFDTVPGVELADFAINGAYREKHPKSRGCGKHIFQGLVREVVSRAAKIVGMAVVYLFSLPDERVIANYQSYGFSRLPVDEEAAVHARLKPRYDQSCVFMYMMF